MIIHIGMFHYIFKGIKRLIGSSKSCCGWTRPKGQDDESEIAGVVDESCLNNVERENHLDPQQWELRSVGEIPGGGLPQGVVCLSGVGRQKGTFHSAKIDGSPSNLLAPLFYIGFGAIEPFVTY